MAVNFKVNSRKILFEKYLEAQPSAVAEFRVTYWPEVKGENNFTFWTVEKCSRFLGGIEYYDRFAVKDSGMHLLPLQSPEFAIVRFAKKQFRLSKHWEA